MRLPKRSFSIMCSSGRQERCRCDCNRLASNEGIVFHDDDGISDFMRTHGLPMHNVTDEDAVTGLAPLTMIAEYLRAAFAVASAWKGGVTVFYADLDRFHVINTTFGRAVGDYVLRTVATRLNTLVANRGGQVAHVAGDEFAVVLMGPRHEHGRASFGEAMRARIAQPIQFGDQVIHVTSSVGISCFPENGSSPAELLRQAEAAMR